jgi:hypothetical protein
MRLRAAHINKVWDLFWQHRLKCDARRLYDFFDTDPPEIRDHKLRRAARTIAACRDTHSHWTME